MARKKHIELFAGCGGLSLGMEQAGIDLLMANELSPMAGETFAYNLLGDVLDQLLNTSTLWLSSKYNRNDISRLRENPFESLFSGEHDVTNTSDINRKLIIGDVRQLKGYLETYSSLLEQLKGVDVLSGGPPCQGFSLAGLRKKDDFKNSLPLTFAKLAGLIKPKIVLLENVKGIIAPFTVDNEKYHAWIEISKAFSLEGYVPFCMMVNSKYFGVPQNRPRFILIGVNVNYIDLAKRILEPEVFSNSFEFYNTIIKERDINVKIPNFKYWDLESSNHFPLFDGKLFPKAILSPNNWISVSDAIYDLINYDGTDMDIVKTNYALDLDRIFQIPKHIEELRVKNNRCVIKNHELRQHEDPVKARFSFYQIISKCNGGENPSELLNLSRTSKNDSLIKSVYKEYFQNQEVLTISGKVKKIRSLSDFTEYLNSIPLTRKHSQRALISGQPAPAQLTIPDDVCHYEKGAYRTLSVREMARIQSFPDWFEFRSKPTTGGTNRRFEVPQYTQVGNAVPPLLGLALGKSILNFLESI